MKKMQGQVQDFVEGDMNTERFGSLSGTLVRKSFIFLKIGVADGGVSPPVPFSVSVLEMRSVSSAYEDLIYTYAFIYLSCLHHSTPP